MHSCTRVSGQDRLNCLWQAGQAIHASDEAIFHAAIVQLGEHGKPEFGPFVLRHPHAQQFFLPLHRHPQYQIDGLIDDALILTHFDHQAIHVQDGIERL